MTITASLVRELREKTGAAMMDCKKALEATGGDLEGAIDHLRKSGLKTAEKKSQRETGDGRVFAHLSDDKSTGALISVQCETDFVAKTEDFSNFLAALAGHVLEHGPSGAEDVLTQSWSAGGTVDEALKLVIGRLGENIRIADVRRVGGPGQTVGSYIHHNDKVGVVVAVSGEVSEETLKDLSLHVAFHKPRFLKRDDVDAESIEREKAVYLESDEVKKKPEEIRPKIVEGKLNSFFKEQCLVEQPWIKDDKQTVEKALKGASIESFCWFEIGG